MTTVTRANIDAYILTGGNSSRMGSPKGRLVLGGRTFVDRIASALAGHSDTIFTVGSDDAHPTFKNVPDKTAGEGRSSTLGLYTALSHARTEWIFVVACDLPFVTEEFFGRLASLCSSGYGAVIPTDSDGIPQPLCGLYRVAECVDKCADSVRRGDLVIRNLLTSVNVGLVPFESLRSLKGADNFFKNINTPEDLRSAEALVQA